MLGWFKKKFAKKEEAVQDVADLKIPVAPRPTPPESSTQTEPPVVEKEIIESTPHIEETPADDSTDNQVAETPSPTEESETPTVPVQEEPASEIEEVEPPLETVAPEPSVEPDSEAEKEIEHDLQPTEFSEIEPAAEVELESTSDNEDVTSLQADEELTETPPDILPEPHTPETQPLADERVEQTVDDQTEEHPPQIAEEPQEEVAAEPVIEKKIEVDLSQKIPVAPIKTPVEQPAAQEGESVNNEKSIFTRLKDRLTRTRESFTYRLDTLFLGKKEIDAELLDDLEELLITADLGLAITQEVLDHARRKVKRNELSDPESLKEVLKEQLASYILEYQEDATLVMPDEGPFVIMVVGVNGVGKTTTIGKIAHKFLASNQSVVLVAADTFRAAAVSQLKIWGERNDVPVITKEDGADPSSVVYDGIAHAKAKGYDVVLVDTAGRLHTQSNLMEELKKIKRVMGKQLEGAPHEVMLVIDATTGQNGISQAKLFNEAVSLTGMTLTKLDGTAKGGIVINICKELQLPIRFIGVGEQLEDLRDFDPDEFIDALFVGDNSSQQ